MVAEGARLSVELLVKVLIDVLGLPAAHTKLVYGPAVGVLHVERGRCALGVRHGQVGKLTRALLDEL